MRKQEEFLAHMVLILLVLALPATALHQASGQDSGNLFTSPPSLGSLIWPMSSLQSRELEKTVFTQENSLWSYCMQGSFRHLACISEENQVPSRS